MNATQSFTATDADTYCIHRINPRGGFQASHYHLCARECGDGASHHLSFDYWCGNVCLACADRMMAAKRGGVLTQGIITSEDQQ